MSADVLARVALMRLLAYISTSLLCDRTARTSGSSTTATARYHEACDDITNLSTQALCELGDAAAHAVLTLALTKTGFFPDGSRVAGRTQAVDLDFDYKGAHAIR